MVAILAPQLVVTGVTAYGLFILHIAWERRRKRAMDVLRGRGVEEKKPRSWEEPEEFKNSRCDPVTRLVFRPDLINCAPSGYLLVVSTMGWVALAFTYEMSVLLGGHSPPSVRFELVSTFAGLLVFSYRSDVATLLPGFRSPRSRGS
ncbi:hypothetical protein [Methanopyrus kandleri]|uniref:Uncharacterized membrane protein specific for M.kandleri, MK-17 family n=2 Tax=Methanopyrus kandleri TaxID=2320 RepID=Q8TW95_METKA|nr:hypothetical protein [Methanopyrus kandleri]AAM02354.1 Uncharacterized membrane protein specific for M.kandleri, MK-17 family [Methanopyrus kandleri AV19]HII69777.1 hypothetical protein [Methanopyrus kandleri]